MFGNYFRALDDKNRVMIPSKLRDSLGDVFFITLGPDNILEMRNENSFSKYRDALLGQNFLNKNARIFARVILGNTIEASADKQGRVVLPEQFLTKLGITKDIAFVGVGDKVEIWSKESYEQFQTQFEGEDAIDELAAKLLKDGVELNG